MTYYDDFELDCGCRMWCKCDKVRYCPKCRKNQVIEAGTYGIHRCRTCDTEVKLWPK